MRLEYTDGCVCTSLTVDGVETINLSKEEVKKILCKMINAIDDIADLQSVWMHIMRSMGEYTDLGHCEECGDYIENYKWEI